MEPVTVTLNPNNTDEIPEDLYEYLLDQLIEKAHSMGYDMTSGTRTLVLDNWVISATLQEVK